MKKMNTVSRIIITLAALALMATYFVPIWAIYLVAPQYPEGLEMNIWLSKIAGQVDIINGLNHYIGMKEINAEMFPEFKFLPYIIAFIMVYGFAVAISGSRKFLGSYCILLILFAAAALVDFFRWGYDYGHNLNPNAAIRVPGLSYQPPLIGHKQLLNFDAYSYPDTGGWIIIIAALTFIIVWFLEVRKNRKNRKSMPASISKKATVMAGASLLLFFAGCAPEAEKITYGKDNCAECKMTIMDAKFGGEIISKKGRVFKFDDAHCMAVFLKGGNIKERDIYQILFTEHNSGGARFLNSKETYFAVSPDLKSPMGSNAAAFSSRQEAQKTAAATNGKTADWPALYSELLQ